MTAQNGNDLPRVVNPFKRVSVETHFHLVTKNHVMVAYALNREFNEPGPYTFTLQRSRGPTDTDIETIAEVVDQPFMYDESPKIGQFDRDRFYRVGLRDGNKVQYWSGRAQTQHYWEHQDWLLAREIIRKETLLLRKKVGTKGWLLKRRQWGDPCPVCVDPNTMQVTQPDCPTCYGTGMVGGYYEPMEYWVIMNPTQRIQKLTNDQGVVTAVTETVRALAYPQVMQNDVWVHASTNARYRVLEDITALARHRGIDLILNLRLEELPQSSPVFNFPTP
jgi:hypothetical protein